MTEIPKPEGITNDEANAGERLALAGTGNSSSFLLTWVFRAS